MKISILRTPTYAFILLLLSLPVVASPWQPVLKRPNVQTEAGIGLVALQEIRRDLEILYRVAKHKGSANDRAYLQSMRDGLARQGLSWDEYYNDTLHFVRLVAQNNVSARNRHTYKQEMRQLQDIHHKLRRYMRKSLEELITAPYMAR